MKPINRVAGLPGQTPVVALAATLALLAAACGGGDIGGAGGAASHAMSTKATSPASATTPAPATAPVSDLGSGGGPFCAAARRFESDQQVIHQAERSSAPDGSAAVLRAARDSEAALITLQAQAPGSLQPDMRVVAVGWRPFFNTLIRAQGDLSKVPASVERGMQTTVSEPSFQMVNSYEAQTCHFQPSAH